MTKKVNLLTNSKNSSLFLGFLHLLNAAFTFGYEQQFFLRSITSFVIVLLMYVLANMSKVDKSHHEGKMFLLALILILYNPIIPVHLGSASAWLAPNIFSGAYFLLVYFYFDKLSDKLKKINQSPIQLK
jgi:hypothetical protein